MIGYSRATTVPVDAGVGIHAILKVCLVGVVVPERDWARTATAKSQSPEEPVETRD